LDKGYLIKTSSPMW